MKKILLALLAVLLVLTLASCEGFLDELLGKLPGTDTDNDPDQMGTGIPFELHYEFYPDMQAYRVDCSGVSDEPVTIPETYEGYPVVWIGGNFANATKKLVLPSTVETIGLGNGSTTILEEVVISEANPDFKTIDGNIYSKNGDRLIYYCGGKTAETFAIPDGVRFVGGFGNPPHLKNLIVPASVQSLGNREIYEFYGIDESGFYSEDTFSQIGNSGQGFVFSRWEGLESITVSADHPTLKSIDGNLYLKQTVSDREYFESMGAPYFKFEYVLLRYCPGKKATSFSIPGGVGIIEIGAFVNAKNLTSITIPDSVAMICCGAFGDCVNLESIVLPEGIIVIGKYTFENCYNLRSITIPRSVKYIWPLAFKGAFDNVEFGGLNIRFAGTVEEWKAIKNDDETTSLYVTIICTDGVVEGEW